MLAGNKVQFNVNPEALRSNTVPSGPVTQTDTKKSLLRKRKRTEDPLDEVVVEEQTPKKPRTAQISLEDAFASLSILGKRKLYRLQETVPYSSAPDTEGLVVIEPQNKRIKLHHGEQDGDEQEYVVDIYTMDEEAPEEFLNSYSNTYFMESTLDYGHWGVEYDEDYDSEDSNAEHYHANSYPDELSSSEERYSDEFTSSCDDNSSDAQDYAYFDDYEDFGELSY